MSYAHDGLDIRPTIVSGRVCIVHVSIRRCYGLGVGVVCARDDVAAGSETVADALQRVLIPELERRAMHLTALSAAAAVDVHGGIHVWKEGSSATTCYTGRRTRIGFTTVIT